jgi:tetratricopeptide (TPR) repeat protein
MRCLLSKRSLLLGLLLLCGMVIGEEMDELRFLEIEMTSSPSYENHFQAAVRRLAQGDLMESIELFEGVKQVVPEAYYYLGVAYYRLGEYEKAEDCFENFNRCRADVWQSYHYLVLVKMKQGKIADAEDLLLKILDPVERQRISEYISDYQMLREARRRYAEKQYEEALELYQKISGFQGYRDIGMALSYAGMGRYRESIVLLDSVISRGEDDTLVRWGLFEAGRELALLREMRRAKEYLRKYLALVPDDDAEFLLGRILSEEAKYDSAIFYLRDLSDSIDAFLFFKGRTEYFLGLWSNAEEKLLRHLDRFPKSSYADRTLYILASINFKRKEYDNAVAFWKELVDSFPSSPYVASALQGMGNSYFSMRKYSDALRAYSRVEDYFPSERISAEVSLRIYETEYHLGRHASLVDALRKYVRENPSSMLADRVRLRIANIHYEKGEYYVSIDLLDRIIEDNEGNQVEVEALMQRIQVCQAMDDRSELLASLRSLLNSESAAEYRLYAAGELGALWAEEMRYDSALYYYNLLLDSDVHRENAILKIGRIYGQLGKNQESIAMTERLISEYPASAYKVDAYMLKSRALKNEGDYRTAINILLELTEEVGDRPEVYMEIGNLHFESEEFLDARQNYLKACELYTQNREDAADALILAGDASVAIGDILKGKEYYLHANMIAESHLMKNRAMQKLTALTEQ